MRFVLIVAISAIASVLPGCGSDSSPEVATLGAREWRSGIASGDDVSFVVDRVEMDSKSTRFYVAVKNFSHGLFELTGLSELEARNQPGTKYFELKSGLRASIEVGESATGVIVFPPIRKTSTLALTVFVGAWDPEIVTNVVFLSWP